MAEAHRLPSNTGGRITLFHLVIISLSLMLSLSAWQFSKYQIEKRIALRFQASQNRALGLIEERMKKYEGALWAGVASIRSLGGDASYAEWQTFTRALRIDERYPGVNGIGVIHFQTAQTLDGYIAAQRQERPDFRVYPDHDGPLFMPITFIEPVDINAAAVGLDVAHELNRRTAALAARDTGTAQITGPITLVQDAGSTPGFLFYAPFYDGVPPRNVADRKAQISGAVYAPFVVRKLMEGLLAKDLRDVRFSIKDGDALIYDEHVTADPMYDPNPMFSEKVSLELYGRNWELDIRSDLAFRTENTYAQPTLILIAGLLIECLIIALLFLMSRANKRAVSYADRVTQALKQKSVSLSKINTLLERKNEELEQFAYVASHDLRTPMRGISGLTEMIEEDLEDYFKTTEANPDVRENLQQIHVRVERMAHLTRGIMDLSQVDGNLIQDDPIDLVDAVTAMRLDFKLEEDQLILIGDLRFVHTDVFNFRRVLENLVSNAVKYHGERNRLQITIKATDRGKTCQISVADNGAGIDPKFHQQVFNVFQTLGPSDAPDSTGIGLAIVKKAVEANGGAVELVSSLGEGATFNFSWPNHAESSAIDELKGAA